MKKNFINGMKTLGEADRTAAMRRKDGIIIAQTTTYNHVLNAFSLTPSNQHIPLDTLSKFVGTTRPPTSKTYTRIRE